MARRSISELITDAEARLHDTRSRIAEQHTTIERRRAVGAGLKESVELLENLETIVRLRERRLRYLREWRDLRIAAPNPDRR